MFEYVPMICYNFFILKKMLWILQLSSLYLCVLVLRQILNPSEMTYSNTPLCNIKFLQLVNLSFRESIIYMGETTEPEDIHW